MTTGPSGPSGLVGITGVTGTVGGRVARSLAGERPLRLFARDVAKAPRLAGAEVARLDYGDGALGRQAFDGVTTLFLVSGREHPERRRQHETVIAAAADAGVRHLVYTSFLHASPDSTFTLGRDHAAAEEYVRETGMSWTFLRDSLYGDFLPLMAGDDGVLRGPAGEGRLAAVAQADVSDVAATILRDPVTHAGVAYELTGPQALSLSEIAAVLSSVLDRTVRYEEETVEQAYASRSDYGAPAWEVDAWVSTYTAIAAGELATVSDHVEKLLGRPARTLQETLRPT